MIEPYTTVVEIVKLLNVTVYYAVSFNLSRPRRCFDVVMAGVGWRSERFLKNLFYLEMLLLNCSVGSLYVTDATGPHLPLLRLEACHSRLLDSNIIAAVVGGPGALLGPDCHLKDLATARCP